MIDHPLRTELMLTIMIEDALMSLKSLPVIVIELDPVMARRIYSSMQRLN